MYRFANSYLYLQLKNGFPLKYSQFSPYGYPRYNRHPDKTDSSKIPCKNILQTFDWNELSLLRILANEDTNSRSLRCPH